MSEKISVVSYNILSPNLISSHKVKRDPLAVDNKYRLTLLESEFDILISHIQPILCLQEVSKEWAEEFVCYFAKHNYGFYWAKGTTSFNGYMGPAIAWPLSLTLQKIEVVMPSSFIVPDPMPVARSQTWMTWTIKMIKEMLQKVNIIESIPVIPPKLSERTQASKKTNEAIIATFTTSDLRSFIVSTYHMPCAFTQPELMRLHTEALIAIINTKTKNNPVILAGDFNSLPDSEVYNMLTSQFASAYDPEPDFTNRALYQYDTMTAPVEFSGTIDYVFSRGLKLVSNLPVEKLGPDGNFEDVGTYLPTLGYPSDHLPVGATYEFIN